LDSSREEGGAGTAPPRERQEHARTGGEAGGGAAGAGGGGAGRRRSTDLQARAAADGVRGRMGCGRRMGCGWGAGAGGRCIVGLITVRAGLPCATSSTHGNKLPLPCVLKGGARQTQNKVFNFVCVRSKRGPVSSLPCAVLQNARQ
jgi:hypothetical protein